MLRVLQVIGKMDRAGAETMLMNIYRNIDRTKLQFDFLVFTTEKADYDDEIESLGGKIFHLPAFKGYNYFSIRKELKKFFKEHEYTIVHGHIGSLAPVYLKFAKKHGGYAIVHSHAMDSNRILEKIIYKIFTYRVRYVADYFMACSRQAGIDRFGEEIYNSNNFTIVNNGIDSELYKYTIERHLRLKQKFNMHDKTVYGHIGRFMNQKNHAFLIEVFKFIVEKDKNSVLIMIGKGEEEESIKKAVNKLGIQENVQFWGVRTDIPDMLNMMDVFIFPSFYEGLSVVGVEAQAAGLPCFFSEGIVKDSIITKNVWRYPLEWGPEKWAENILQIVDKFIRGDTRQNIIDAHFDIRDTVEEIQRFYLEHC